MSAHNLHPTLTDQEVLTTLAQFARVRHLVHEVLSEELFGLKDFIAKRRNPLEVLYPGDDLFASSGLLLRVHGWPRDIVHPFGSQQFDGGYYPQALYHHNFETVFIRRIQEEGVGLQVIDSVDGRTDCYAITEVQGVAVSTLELGPNPFVVLSRSAAAYTKAIVALR